MFLQSALPDAGRPCPLLRPVQVCLRQHNCCTLRHDTAPCLPLRDRPSAACGHPSPPAYASSGPSPGERRQRGERQLARKALTSPTIAAQPAPTAPTVRDEVFAVYKRLQNGSDIRGIAVDGVPGEMRNLTPTIAFFLGCGWAELLAERQGVPTTSLRVSIGRDPRVTGPILAAALAAGLTSKGVRVARFGLATTPAMFMSCILPGHGYDAAVMITASHLPYNRNGFKFFTKEGGYEKADITALLKHAAAEQDATDAPGLAPGSRYNDEAYVLSTALSVDPGLIEYVDFMPVYAQHLRTIIKRGIAHPHHPEEPLRGFHIVVDAGNGSGGFLATDVLAPLGADVSGSQFLDPDGWFPNHVPNPEDKAAMAAGVAAVNRSHADLGIVVDTDVDRSAVVAAGGIPINSNRYIALMAYITLQKYPGTTIVTDSVTSNGLSEYIAKLGGKHFRYRRGYKNVIGKGVALAAAGVDCQLMMETSGHGAMAENHYLDDGTYSASQIIIGMARRALEGRGRDVSRDLLAALREPVESREFRLKLLDEDFQAQGKRVLEAFLDWLQAGAGGATGWELEPENHEGWRVAVDEGEGRRGWLLLRASLHDPLLVLNVESDVAGGSCGAVQRVCEFFQQAGFDQSVDISKLYEGCSIGTIKY